MKRTKCIRFLSALLLCAVCLSACAPAGLGSTPQVKNDYEAKQQAHHAAFGYEIPVVNTSHGEDYPIDWQDPGMEAAIRALLGRPDGDILHSDVRDFHILNIGYDPAQKQITVQASSDDAPLRYLDYEGTYAPDVTADMTEDFPLIASFTDLRHFDSLQSLRLADTGSTQGGIFRPRQLDLTGLDAAPNLNCLDAVRFELRHTEVLSACDGLKVLDLRQCGITALDFAADMNGLTHLYLDENTELDLSPLAGLPNLSVVRLYSGHFPSLEPLAELPALRALTLSGETTYPSLEPLTRTRIEVLDMDGSVATKRTDIYDALDYEPLTRIPTLTWLDLTNHRNVDAELGNAIVAGSPNLKYLIVAYTPAARSMERPEQLIYFGNNI